MSVIEQTLDEAAARHPIPGHLALAMRGEEIIFEGAFGPKDQSGGPPLTPDAIFWIASMTKAVTATAALQLVEAGRLGLDAPLGEIIPTLGRAQVLEGFDGQGEPILRPAKRPVTLRRLLNHTSGFVYDMWNAQAGQYMAKMGVPNMGSGLNAALEMPLLFDPGEAWEYGIGIDWAGKVVEAVSGQTLDAYFADHIFAPLGMADTGFRPSPSQADRIAGLAVRTPDGALAPFHLGLADAQEFWSGGGGLFSTARDYMIFLRMILGGGRLGEARILAPETVTEMGRNQIGDLAIRRLKSAAPMLTHDLDLAGGAPAHWGLSWQINPEPGPNGRSSGSLAWAGLANTYYWADPQTGVAGVFMTQLLPFADPNVLAVFTAFERAVYQRLAV